MYSWKNVKKIEYKILECIYEANIVLELLLDGQ